MSAGTQLLRYYDARLERFGDTCRGAAWPNEEERDLRFDVFLDVARNACGDGPFTLYDYACGTGELLRRIRERGLSTIAYAGADASQEALRLARAKFPQTPFAHVAPDAGSGADGIAYDVVIANGLFTVRGDVSEDEMWAFMSRTLEGLWPVARRAIAFNVMSPIVDTRRDDLFHVSYDALAGVLHRIAGRYIGFRADYGLYEYVAYALRAER